MNSAEISSAKVNGVPVALEIARVWAATEDYGRNLQALKYILVKSRNT